MSRDEKRVCVMRNRESDGKRFGGERFRDRNRERYIGGISNNSETEVIQREWDRESVSWPPVREPGRSDAPYSVPY